MYVRRLCFHGLNTLRCDIPRNGDPLPEASRKRLLFQGGNGSGKTTILASIRILWEFFGEWIDRGTRQVDIMRRLRRSLTDSTESSLLSSELAALELGDFPMKGKSLWIGTGRTDAWRALKRQHPEAEFAGLIGDGPDGLSARVELPQGDWQAFRQRSMVGSEPQVNVVYFPPDNRTVAAPPEDGPRLIDTTRLNWSAVFDPHLDLDSLLLTVKALRPNVYEETVRLVNLALGHWNKQIVGFGDNGRLMIEGKTEAGTTYRHPPELLSSGEQQFLILVAYTSGFLRPGGIVLIDDPDLHIHIAMVTQLLQTLDFVVRERQGQLIVASQSERVWDFFPREEEQFDLAPWRGLTS